MKWQTNKLETFCSIIKGKKHDETFDKTGTHRYLQIDDLHTGLNLKFTNGTGAEAEMTDVLIAWDGANAGKVGIGLKGMIGSTLARLRPNLKVINPAYLYWYLDGNFETIKRQRTGATIPHVNGNSLRGMDIPLPPLHIQQQIADTLDKADALRQKDQQLLQKYHELAQSIFNDMFGDPILNEKGWLMKPVIAFADCIVPGRDKPKSFTGSIPWVTTDDLIPLGITCTSKKQIGLNPTEIKEVKAKVIPTNSVIMTCVGDLGSYLLQVIQ